MAQGGGAVDGQVLDLETMRQFSGEEDLGKADMLVLRGLGLVNVAVSAVPKACCLPRRFSDLLHHRPEQALSAAQNIRSLSLSHNVLNEIGLPRGALPVLEELNVNKNALSCLSFLEVRGLWARARARALHLQCAQIRYCALDHHHPGC